MSDLHALQRSHEQLTGRVANLEKWVAGQVQQPTPPPPPSLWQRFVAWYYRRPADAEAIIELRVRLSDGRAGFACNVADVSLAWRMVDLIGEKITAEVGPRQPPQEQRRVITLTP